MKGDVSPEEQLVERIRIVVGGGTDKEIAAELGVSPASITNWKRGEGPGRKRLQQIAEKYSVSLDYLQYGHDENNGETTSGPMTYALFIEELRRLGVEDFNPAKGIQALTTSDMEEILEVVRANARLTATTMVEQRIRARKE